MKKLLFILAWISSLLFVVIFTYENPEIIDSMKYNYIKKYFKPEAEVKKGPVQKVIGNSFAIEFSKEISFDQKTAFIIHDSDVSSFDQNALKIYFQNGYLNKNLETKKLNLPDTFLPSLNGGVKAVFVNNGNEFALISSVKKDCIYSSIISLDKGSELFKTQCLPKKGKIDFNGLGSSHIHYDNKILLSIGAPEQISSVVADLAQDTKSMYGKIVEIDKNELENVITGATDNLKLKTFTSGHRNPQGMTKINDAIFSVEHGPKGGDELNRVIKGKNYGWPIVSYGTKYGYDKEIKSYKINHKKNNFEEPIFALVPSVGISSLNVCPENLKKHYDKPCLIALSLYGNDLRPGRSVFVFVLNDKMDRIISSEQIYLRGDLKLRHFVTNSKNELYQDEAGSIYVSADRKGIFKLSFINFKH